MSEETKFTFDTVPAQDGMDEYWIIEDGSFRVAHVFTTLKHATLIASAPGLVERIEELKEESANNFMAATEFQRERDTLTTALDGAIREGGECAERSDRYRNERDVLTTQLAESKAEVEILTNNEQEARDEVVRVATELSSVGDQLIASIAQVKELREGVMAMVDLWVALAKSGDAGFWDPEVYDEVKQARCALKNTEPKS